MQYAHSTNIDKLLESIDQHLGRVQHAFIALIALVFAADDTSFHDPALFSPESKEQAEGRERLFSLIRLARDKGEEAARALDAAQTALAERSAYYAKARRFQRRVVGAPCGGWPGFSPPAADATVA
jgi:hypothetical protein